MWNLHLMKTKLSEVQGLDETWIECPFCSKQGCGNKVLMKEKQGAIHERFQ